MRTEKGIALPLVMGLLLAITLIGLGLLSQTILSTRFFEAASMSYMGMQAARQQLEQRLDANPPISDLFSAVGKDQSHLVSTVLFAVPAPAISTDHGYLLGNVWRPGTCGEYYRNFNQSPGVPVTYNDGIYTYVYSSDRTDGRFDESSFLFKDQAGENGTDVLKTWTNYTMHLEFNADYSPGFGVYFNAYPHPDNLIHTLSGYLFEISPYNLFTKQNEIEHNSTFYTAEVQNGNQNPSSGTRHSVQFNDSSIGDATLATWTGATSAGVGTLYDAWHSIDISVQSAPDANNPSNTSSNTVVVKVDNVQVLSFADTQGTIFSPGLIGLGNTAGNYWQSSVGFRNVMVTNNSP